MAKTIYTERDIEDLARRGVKEIALTDEVVLTDIARERAEKLGITLRAGNTASPAALPTRETTQTRSPSTAVSAAQPDAEAVIGKVKADVLAKLGPGIDPSLIDRIVRRVVSQLK